MDRLETHGPDDGKSGEELASELQSIGQEHEHSSAAPFVLKLDQEDRSAFASVVDKISLANMLRAIEPLARHHEARGGTFSESERNIIELFRGLANDERHKGRELGAMDLQFR